MDEVQHCSLDVCPSVTALYIFTKLSQRSDQIIHENSTEEKLKLMIELEFAIFRSLHSSPPNFDKLRV